MDPELSQALGWMTSLVHVALAMALLVVALVRTRQASASGGYLLAAAAGIDALGSCCGRGLSVYWRHAVETDGYEAAERLSTIQPLLSLTVNVVAGGLLVAGFAVAARAVSVRRAS